MIIEALALSGVLLVGYKEYEKDVAKAEDEAPKPTIDNEIKIVDKDAKKDSAATARLQRLFQGTDDQSSDALIARQTFERENTIGILSAGTSLGLAIGGVFNPVLGIASVPFLAYNGRKIYRNTIKQLKEGKVSVDTLLALTLTGCLIGGYFIAASIAMLMMRSAERLVAKVTQESKQNLMESFSQQPNVVWIEVDGIEVKIPFEKLRVDDIVVAHAGEMIPADGEVVDGIANVDQHILTGEAHPVDREKGDKVFASTIVLSGNIRIKVEKAGSEATVAKIINVLNNTIDFKSSTQLRAESLSLHLVKPALIAGTVALPLVGFSGALAAVNSHPKDKMMIIAPISILNYLNIATEHGILIKDGRSLELLNKVDTLIFDKTGTLTEEQPHVGRIYSCSDYTELEILTYAAAAEYKQTHPVARAVLHAANHVYHLEIPKVEESEYKLGFGLTVQVNGRKVHVGSHRFMEVENIEISQTMQTRLTFSYEQGHSMVMVAVNDKLIGAVELVPTVRPEAKEIIDLLKQHTKIDTTYIISGDSETPTSKLAHDLGIDYYFAETLPENKAELIGKLQDEGRFICYVGDGINDSIALKKAQVSISLSGASTVATDTAQIILMDSGLKHLPALFELAKEFNSNMNMSFALMVTPAILSIGGTFLLSFGIAQSIMLNMVGLSLGVGNAMRPYVMRKLGKRLQQQIPLKPNDNTDTI
ncbi:MAG: heavy metal translocating P-type ATPase [Thiotrichaceae bacterium]|nr:heavy metal translocating P-type ATPase [Thiotrichaceae bacterium]